MHTYINTYRHSHTYSHARTLNPHRGQTSLTTSKANYSTDRYDTIPNHFTASQLADELYLISTCFTISTVVIVLRILLVLNSLVFPFSSSLLCSTQVLSSLDNSFPKFHKVVRNTTSAAISANQLKRKLWLNFDIKVKRRSKEITILFLFLPKISNFTYVTKFYLLELREL